MWRFVLALVIAVGVAMPAVADDARLDALFAALKGPAAADEAVRKQVEDRIWAIWSESGSASLDYLLKRGREAIAAEDYGAAIEHLTALVENAPDFAEGWNARATAYFKAGYFGPAVADLGRVLTLEPRHFGALSGLGIILEESGDKPGALAAFRAAIAIHPYRPDLREAADRLEAELQGDAI